MTRLPKWPNNQVVVKHGGKRAGAGRPRDDEKVRLTLYVPRPEYRELLRRADQNLRSKNSEAAKLLVLALRQEELPEAA